MSSHNKNTYKKNHEEDFFPPIVEYTCTRYKKRYEKYISQGALFWRHTMILSQYRITKSSGRILHASAPSRRRCEIPGGFGPGKCVVHLNWKTPHCLRYCRGVWTVPIFRPISRKVSLRPRVLPTVRPHAFRAFERADPHCDGGALIHRANKKSWHRHNEKLVMRDHCCRHPRTIGPYRVKPCKQWCLRRPIRFTSGFSSRGDKRKLHPGRIKHAPKISLIVGFEWISRATDIFLFSAIFPSRLLRTDNDGY